MRKILIVDKNSDLLEILSIFLERKGFDVITTDRASAVFKLAHHFKPNFILIDIFLGQFDGRDICREIKSNKLISNAAIILTSRIIISDTNYVQCKCDDFIEKPIDVLLLMKKLALPSDCNNLN